MKIEKLYAPRPFTAETFESYGYAETFENGAAPLYGVIEIESPGVATLEILFHAGAVEINGYFTGLPYTGLTATALPVRATAALATFESLAAALTKAGPISALEIETALTAAGYSIEK